MIFDEIILHNFGVYKGKHMICLSPESPEKPVVIFGGHNGAGKTTLLDAFKLVLFGKFADCAGRGKQPYLEYLKKSINRNVPSSEGASISLTFRNYDEGTEQVYTVKRSWCSTGKGCKENIDVSLNREYNRILSESWGEIVGDFIPMEISRLFFFDGEKIKDLADLSQTAELLSTGIHSLLGLDLVNKLEADLAIIVRNKLSESKKNGNHDRVNAIRTELNDAGELRCRLKGELCAAQEEVGATRDLFAKKEDSFKKQGGDFYNQRESFVEQKNRILSELDKVQSQLIELSSSALPLSLVTDLLDGVIDQDKKEQDAIKNSMVLKVLEKRDRDLLKVIKKTISDSGNRHSIGAYLKNDREKRKSAEDCDIIHNLNVDERSQIYELKQNRLPSLKEQAKQTMVEKEDLTEQLLLVERKLEMAPSLDQVASVMKEIDALSADMGQKEVQLLLKSAEYDQACLLHENLEKNLTKEIEKSIECSVENEADRRIVEHSKKAQATLKKFKSETIKQHISTIESYVLESADALFRKKSFIRGLTIDPKTFELSLMGSSGELSPDTFSAGERQILATTLLWGLTQASRYPLPAIIDTPLGRLDSIHRKHLIDKYLPNASHQVIILSTDEEITQAHYLKMSDRVSHAYYLDFDNTTESTRVHNGYFGELI